MRPRLRLALTALAALVAGALVLVVALGGSSGRSSSTSSQANTGTGSGFEGVTLPAGVNARGFTLTDQRGRRVSLADYRGRVTILTFLYSTCPHACVVIAQQVRGALDELGPGVAAVAISMDPSSDTPARVHAFLERAALNGRLEYLTGPRTQLAPVWRAYRVMPASAGEAAYAGTAPVLLLDRDGRERVLFGLEQLTPEGLAHDARKLEGG
jgi:cytochrome oxidase Cu insertion factor (SCO1/SenC/PrrC family)